MSLLVKSSSKASSRRQIAIKTVEEDVLVLPHNKYRAILEVSAINLELKNDAEKDAIIETYESFLNSLPCEIQVLIKVRELDVDNYLERYAEREKVETEDVYITQLQSYQSFVRGLIKEYKILSRRFFITVPYDGEKKTDFDFAKDRLNLNVGIIKGNLEKLGMGARRLTTMEILDLFYTYYNPKLSKLEPLKAETMQMLTSQYI
jgi:hypothetical protein